jgi:hypothetical protein
MGAINNIALQAINTTAMVKYRAEIKGKNDFNVK